MKPKDRYKILVVDDSPQDVRVILDSLSQTYDAFFAMDGPEALRISEREYPDLTLLDIYMDGMDGFEVCRRIKRIPQIAENPIIFITGSSEEADHVKGLERGAVDFIAKPINTTVLKQRVALHLRLISAIKDGLIEIEARKRAEEMLQKRERLYRMLAENITDVIWTVDENHNYTYVSPSIFDLLGYSSEELLGCPLNMALTPGSRSYVQKATAKAIERLSKNGGRPFDLSLMEYEMVHKSGKRIWVEVRNSFLTDHNGIVNGMIGVTRDISVRKEAQRKIVESEKKYRNLFENGSDLICLHDLEGNLLDTNLPYKERYGWQKEDIEGLNIREMIPERHRAKFDQYLARILKRGADEGYLKGFTKSGQEVILEYRNKLILDENGKPQAVQGAARDVTHRIRSENALKESEEKYREIVKRAPAGIFELDMAKVKFISVNDVMCEYTGYTKDELLEKDPYSIMSKASRQKAKNLIEQAFSGEKNPPPVEYTIHGKDGQKLTVIANSKFFFENGTPKKVMMVVHDVTQIRKAEEEKRRLEAKLQNVKKLESLGALAGGVAHDLNNILSGIVSYPDLLLTDIETNSPLREPLLTIKKSGQKAAEIVQDLLTLTRRNIASKKVVNLNQIVNDLITSPEYSNIIGNRSNLTMKTMLSEDMLNILGSDAHLSKTVMNLLANAADAMPAGGEITVSTKDCYIDTPYTGFETVPQGEYAVLEVSDLGIGMSSSDLEKIFEPFYTKKAMRRSGTGLGMSVVWGTVKDLGGFIDVITKEGSGTTFVLYFPASRSKIETPSMVYIEDYLGKGESILIVDDAKEQRGLAKQMMQRLGYDAHTAASGEEAVELIKNRPYEILLLDMIMPPGMDGLETYKQIVTIAPDQKVVIASGYAETERVRKAQQMGAGSYIKKPFTLEKIGLAVRNELDRKNELH